MKLVKIILFLLISFNTPLKANSGDNIQSILNEGGKLIFIRHAYAPGGGDPDNFDILNCASQRNLNEEGIEQAKKIGKFFLEKNSLVSKVYYPGLVSHDDHEIAKNQMSGYGGMLSIEISSEISPIIFLKNLRIIKPVMSLGGIESTANYPKLTSHFSLTQKERSSQGISSQLIRLSLGIESIEDLKNDINSALNNSLNES